MAVGKTLQDGVIMMADGAKDVVAAVAPGQTLAQKVMQFENLLGDALKLSGEAGDFSAEIGALVPGDYPILAGMLIDDLAFSSDKAHQIVPLILQALSDAGAKMVPDVLAIIAAMKS